MSRTSLTGSRIRERRQLKQMRQAELAKAVGISASYLNLIEHNRRRIGGKLLLDIAGALDVEPTLLAEGAEEALIERLRQAAQANAGTGAELVQVEEFAGRFPGWARLIVEQGRREADLLRSLDVLNDRLANDPQLAATLHEILSTVTAIRSTASILVENREIEPEWRFRFHRNINEDAQRLAEGAEALVRYLDTVSESTPEEYGPREQCEAFLARARYHFPELETGHAHAELTEVAGRLISAKVDRIVGKAKELQSAEARALTIRFLEQYRRDAAMLSLKGLRAAVAETGADPIRVSQLFAVDVATVMRRLATLPELGLGLVICDAAGVPILRKPVDSMSGLPPMWPIYKVLNRPMVPIHERQVQTGQKSRETGEGGAMALGIYAVSMPAADRTELGHDMMLEAQMLLVPEKTE